MPLENTSKLLELNSSWPLGASDLVSDGDDHLRLIKSVLIAAYPVGSVLFNKTGVNPSTYIGGTWAATAVDRAIVGAGGDYAAGDQFGADSKSLDETNIPEHTHWVDPPATFTDWQGEHNHVLTDPGHTHNAVVNGLNAGGNRNFGPTQDNNSVQTVGDVIQGAVTGITLADSGDHRHTVDIPGFASEGYGQAVVTPLDMRQRSEAIFAWERTA